MMKKNLLLLSIMILLMSAFSVMAEEEEPIYYFHITEGPATCFYETQPGYETHILRPTVSRSEFRVKADTLLTITYEVYSEVDDSVLFFTEFPYQHGVDGTHEDRDPIFNTSVFSFNLGQNITYPYRFIYTIKTFDKGNELVATSYNEFLCPEQDGSGTLIKSSNVILSETPDVPNSNTLTRNPILSDPYTAVSVANLNFTVWNRGQPVFNITSDTVNAVSAGEQHTLIAQSDNGYYRFYRLNTGELQLNTGPDFEGKEFVTVFNAGGQVVKTYTIDPQ